MGVVHNDTTLVAPKPKGIVDPSTGKPVGSDDAYFTEINDELADKGFLVTTTDDLITWARTGSLIRCCFFAAEAIASSSAPIQRSRSMSFSRATWRRISLMLMSAVCAWAIAVDS
jgi:NADH-quinone oxidoreductase subunit B